MSASNPSPMFPEEFAPSPKGAPMSKVEKWKWKMKGVPGKYVQLDKRTLTCDPEYQRESTASRVTAIASHWSWMSLGVILVAHRGGRYFVFDGYHRVQAALKRADIHLLPCLVWESEGQVEEAHAYLDVNTNRKPMLSVEKFNALVMKGDPDAVGVKALLDESGYAVSKSAHAGRYVKCVGELMRCHRSDRGKLVALWPTLLDVFAGGPFRYQTVTGLWYIETRLPEGLTITKNPWRQKLIRAGGAVLEDACYRAKQIAGKGGEAVAAQGLLAILNKGTTTRRLTLE